MSDKIGVIMGKRYIDEFKPRRPYWDEEPDGYMESDKDFVMNNLDLCLRFLEKLEERHAWNQKNRR